MAKWQDSDVEVLKHLYKECNLPSDELVKDKSRLEVFTSDFNKRVNIANQFSPKEVADQLFKLRKSGKLPRIRE